MNISDFLGKERLSVSFEYFPPKSESARKTLMEAIGNLAHVAPDFVSITYGAGGSTRNQTFDLCQMVQSQTAGLVMAHLTCICHSRNDIQEIADRLWDAGISNIMALRGDRPQSVADQGLSRAEFRFSHELIAYLKGNHPFCVGGACYPEGHSETPDVDTGIDHLLHKIDAGCDFLVTQMFFDNDAYFRFVDRLAARKIEVPVLPGIMPITSFAQVEKFEGKFGAYLPPELRNRIRQANEDQGSIEEVGIDWTLNQCRALIEGGAPGIHFYTLNKSGATRMVCESLNLHRGQRLVRT